MFLIILSVLDREFYYVGYPILIWGTMITLQPTVVVLDRIKGRPPVDN